MKLILCIDDRGGYSFHHRRLSSDRVQKEHMKRIVAEAEGKLYYNRYTEKDLCKEEISKARETYEFCMEPGAAFLKMAQEESAFAFVENVDWKNYISEITEIFLYRWNRTYPYDLQLSENLLEKFQKIEEEEFAGYSHEKITFQRYVRGEKCEGDSVKDAAKSDLESATESNVKIN